MIKRKISGSQLKHILLYGMILISVPFRGQTPLQKDTIRIKEVIISRRPISSDLPGFKKTIIDTVLLRTYNHISLAELLAISSPVFIKSYGSGGSATSSLRGTGASHTQVSWNGININNPMLGQTDFSLIFPGFTDNIQISFGGASMDIGNGGIGGIISIENKPDWSGRTQLIVNPGIGSFGRYTLLTRIKTGNERFLSVTKAHLHYAVNDYPYLNTEISADPVWEKRENNKLSQKDFMQEFYFRKSADNFSARIWYQSAARNLPGSMLIQSGNTDERQFDESLRSMLSFNSKRGIFVTGAWMFTKLNYSNLLASIESINVSNSFMVKGGFETTITPNTTLKIFINEELNAIKSNNYEKNVSGNTVSLTISAEKKSGNRFGASMLIRELLDNNKLLIPDFSAGIEFRLFAGEDHFIRAGFSRNSKIPSMNDRYWYPGGNLHLNNEYAFLYDLGYKMMQKLSQSVNINAEVSLFRNYIKDMIQWHPGEYTYWIADNLNSVNSSGLESSVSVNYSFNELTLNFNAGYSFTRAVSVDTHTDVKSEKQLMYIPENQANSSLQAGFKDFYSIWVTNFTGRRYIVTDNSRYLPGYSVSNIICGMKFKLKENLFDVNFKIENVFSKSYQAIAYYPQPGRSYYVSLLYQLNKIINQ